MNLNFIKSIYKFNKELGLLEQGYNDKRESSFQIEEALEGFKGLDNLYEKLGGDDEWGIDPTPKNLSRLIVQLADTTEEPIPDVDRLDKACDAIVFAFGSIFKLGLTPQEAVKAMEIVMRANMQKLNSPKDEYGKTTKPEGFIGPEEELKKLLKEK